MSPALMTGGLHPFFRPGITSVRQDGIAMAKRPLPFFFTLLEGGQLDKRRYIIPVSLSVRGVHLPVTALQTNTVIMNTKENTDMITVAYIGFGVSVREDTTFPMWKPGGHSGKYVYRRAEDIAQFAEYLFPSYPEITLLPIWTWSSGTLRSIWWVSNTPDRFHCALRQADPERRKVHALVEKPFAPHRQGSQRGL